MPAVKRLFRPSQIYAMAQALIGQERAEALQRQDAARRGAKISRAIRATDALAAHYGISGRTLEKIIEVCEAAEAEPEQFGALREEMDRNGTVHGPHRKLKRARDTARIAGLAPVDGLFRTLVFDPPWEDESISESQRPPYATLGYDEIRAIPVQEWQMDEGHLYIHAPGPFLGAAIALVGHWGYAFKTVIAWRKPRWSMGRYFRTKAEFIAFGTRGGLMTKRQDVANVFDGPVGAHSEKPESFYDLVRAQSFPPYGEGFQIRPRPDFTNLYAERGGRTDGEPAAMPAMAAE